ncbi:MAG: S1 RNA-binding domain-containing protein, partial [Acidobacteriota bacterium]
MAQQNETATQEFGFVAAEDLELDYEQLVALYDESMRHLDEGEIVTGYVVDITDSEVVVDVGYKSEGLIPLDE